MQVDGNFGRIKQPTAFAAELVGPTNAHRHERTANLTRHDKCAFLQRAHLARQRPCPFGEDNYADSVLDMRADLLQRLLKLGWSAAVANGDVPESFHHPAISRDLEMRVQLQSANELRDGRIDDESIKKVYMVANKNAGLRGVKPRRRFPFETDSGKPQDVAEEKALGPIVPAGIDENPQNNQGSADCKEMQRANQPKQDASNHQVRFTEWVHRLSWHGVDILVCRIWNLRLWKSESCA